MTYLWRLGFLARLTDELVGSVIRAPRAKGVNWVEARDATNILQCPEQLSAAESYLFPNTSSAKSGKPWCNQIQRI